MAATAGATSVFGGTDDNADSDDDDTDTARRPRTERRTFEAADAGEALLELTASAPGTDWIEENSESAVVTVALDGEYNQDVVLFRGGERFTYPLALGPVESGEHTVTVTYDPAKSPVGSDRAVVHGTAASVVPESDERALVHRYSPVLYGRDLPNVAGDYENGYTDVPLLLYHTTSTDDETGHTTIEYTVIWSNEDGGTDTPGLMGSWGRTTDIEWIYRVTVDDDGEIVSEEYQGNGHTTLPFTGAKMGDHPLLETSTINNMVAKVNDPDDSTGYRFFLDPSRTLPEGRAREAMMDRNPWTYEIMAKGMVREGRLESVDEPTTTPAVSDLRNYLYVEFDKETTYETDPVSEEAAVGTALAVRLTDGSAWYTSHHGDPDATVVRNDPAATTVELPPGTDGTDVAAIEARSVPLGKQPADYETVVSSIERAFFLGDDYLPTESIVEWNGSVTLTPQNPDACLWRRDTER
ncbi:hypothetical protein ACFQPA_05990 [Halomarina halobia]|uniref:hypothetical protein n=1 Tax=Halomarina halobia TaxID=3033386 RepID=UPI003618B3DE